MEDAAILWLQEKKKKRQMTDNDKLLNKYF